MTHPRSTDHPHACRAVVTDAPYALVKVSGADRLTFLHNMTTAAVKGRSPGSRCEAAVVDHKGLLLAWVGLLVDRDWVWVTLEAGDQDALIAWFDRYIITEDVTVERVTARHPVCLLLAPAAYRAPSEDGKKTPLSRIGQAFVVPGLMNEAILMLPESDPTTWLEPLRQDGFEVWTHQEWEDWRIAWGLPAARRDRDARTNPWEWGLTAAISLDKGCYLGQEVIARLNTYDKVQRCLMGLDFETDAVHLGAEIQILSDPAAPVAIGVITSLTPPVGPSPGRALALIKRNQAEEGRPVAIVTPDGRTHLAHLRARWFQRGQASLTLGTESPQTQ
ncbi:MAG: hypothetical protein VKP62_07870 [Candidatus Sericytochromatia bacterium]|nr:hypothetical protein [Candidatus Sericytochromatia bacterium]